MHGLGRAGFLGWNTAKPSQASTCVLCLLFALGCGQVTSSGSGGAVGLGAEGGATDSSAEGGATSITGGSVAMGGELGIATGGSATGGERAVAACDGLPLSDDEDSMCGVSVEFSVAPSCRFELPTAPEGTSLDLMRVELRFVPSAEPEQRFLQVGSVDACEAAPNGGWYVAPNSSEVTLCPCTCARIATPGITTVRLPCYGLVGIR